MYYVSVVLALLVAFFPQALATEATHLTQARRLDSQTRRTASGSQCQPFHSTFSQADFGSRSLLAGGPSFVAVSPASSFNIGPGGLQLFLEKPHGSITTKDGVNSQVADGATINSTFTLLYGKVTLNFLAPLVSGVVTAAILIGDGSDDEIDIELLGGDPTHWQTNVFATSPKDIKPLWGVFGQVEDYANKGTVEDEHAYTIDWNDERVVWSVDGEEVRTLKKDQTQKNGALHFPSHPTRIQLGIWDASSPAGTAQWAKGPIDWSSAPARMAATFKSVVVECPYN